MTDNRMPEERLTEIQARADAATGGPWEYIDNGFDGYITSSMDPRKLIIFGGEPCEGRIEPDDPNAKFVITARTDIPDLLAALRAAYQREEMLLGEVQAAHRREDAIAAELAAVKRERDAAHEIDLRRIRPGYMGVCLTDEEDGIEIREASHKHSQGRGYLDDKPEYISRDAAFEVCSEAQGKAASKGVLTGISQVWRGLKRIPAEDVAPVKRGRWVDGHCDQCGCYAEDDRIGGNFYTAYCANCGAKMTVSARMDAKEDAHDDQA